MPVKQVISPEKVRQSGEIKFKPIPVMHLAGRRDTLVRFLRKYPHPVGEESNGGA